MLYAYCMGILKNNRHLKRIIGIATEPPGKPNGTSIASEDMITINTPSTWTSDIENEIDELCKQYEIFDEDTFRITHHEVQEYPEE